MSPREDLDLNIANPSFAIATEEGTNTYKLAGDFSVLGETFNLSTSFTESTGGGLDFQELSIPNFSIGTLTAVSYTHLTLPTIYSV